MAVTQQTIPDLAVCADRVDSDQSVSQQCEAFGLLAEEPAGRCGGHVRQTRELLMCFLLDCIPGVKGVDAREYQERQRHEAESCQQVARRGREGSSLGAMGGVQRHRPNYGTCAATLRAATRILNASGRCVALSHSRDEKADMLSAHVG